MLRPACHLLLGLLALSSAACAAPTDEDDGADSTEDAVIGGAETYERPEIGILWHGGMCTGTLVRPNVVITAMHCGKGTPIDEDVSNADPGYVFEIRKSPTEKHRYKVVRAESIAQPADFDGSQKWRAKDILLLKLESSVPPEVAKPANIATSTPEGASKIALYGYGCTSRTPGDDGRRPGTGTKRSKDFWWTVWLSYGWEAMHTGTTPRNTFTVTRSVCPGDSGGPLLDVNRNAVFGTNSGYVADNDKFGHVPEASAKLNALADRWAAEALAPAPASEQ